MNQASILLSEELKNISFKNPNIPILHNINASESHGDISNLLTDQLTQPVQWSKTMEKIKSYNGIVVECGPGKVLSGLAKNNGLTDIYSMSSSQFEEDFNNIYE